MSVSEPYDDRLMADLAAAADGTLPPARAQELEAMAERDPELAAALDDQRRALTLIRGAASEVRAPLALRERLEAQRSSSWRPRAARRWFSVATVGALAAATRRRCTTRTTRARRSPTRSSAATRSTPRTTRARSRSRAPRWKSSAR